jgi:ADP-heptose:LPS heptosyltransferase
MNRTKRQKRDRTGLLIILPGGLGDLVQAREVLQDVVRRSPDGVDLLTGNSLVELARSWGVFGSVLSLPADVFYHGSPARRAALIVRMVREIRGRRYESCLLFKAHPLYAIMAYSAGIPTRMGLRRGWAPLLTHSVPLRGDVHRVDRLRQVAALATGGELDPPRARQRAAHRRQAALTIGIAPGGARNEKEEMPSRRWPLANYRALATALGERFPHATFVLLGGAADASECDGVMSALPAGRGANLCGTLRPEELEQTIAGLDVVITHDSGLFHVAGQTGCGLVGIFGPTDPRVVAPRGAGVTTLWSPAGPVPCHDEVFGVVNCAYAPCCIERVSVAAVVQAVEGLVGESTQSPGA